MHPTKYGALLIPLCAIALVLFAHSAQASHESDTCTAGWDVMTLGTWPTHIYDTVVLGPDDVWAVGSQTNAHTGDTIPLLMHYNGHQWLTAPNPMKHGGEVLHGSLIAVSASRAGDVWALGDSTMSAVLHYGGHGLHWTYEPLLLPAPYDNPSYRDIAVVSDSDVWVVGRYHRPGTSGVLNMTIRFDGTVWSNVPSPNISVPGVNALVAVSALPTGQVWAVGNIQTAGPASSAFTGFVLYYPGQPSAQWQLAGYTPRSQHALSAVVATSPSSVWAVGTYPTHQGGPSEAVAAHFDGVAWTMQPPNPVNSYGQGLQSISGGGGDDVWAVGYYSDGMAAHLLVQHYNGAVWQRITAPDIANLGTLSVSARSEQGAVWVTQYRGDLGQVAMRYGCSP